MTTRERITVEDFEHIVHLPENADKRLEYIEGNIWEALSTNLGSYIAGRLNYFLFAHLQEYDTGWFTEAKCGYAFGDDRYLPNIAYLCYQDHLKPTGEYFRAVPPTLIIEIISSEDAAMTFEVNRILNIKVSNYVAAGTVVWVVRPEPKTVEVHAPGQAVQVLCIGDSVPGGDILPGFTLKLSDIFAD